MKEIPCKKCISYAICYQQELIMCSELYDMVDSESCTEDGSISWDKACIILPNMERLRWRGEKRGKYQYKPGYTL